MMKYLKVEVTKTLSTDLYIEVPDDFDVNTIRRWEHQEELGRIAGETTSDMDWDDSYWQDTVEAISASVVTETEATQFMVGKYRENRNE